MRNLDEFITKNLNINIEMSHKFLEKTKFLNKDLEEKYQKHQLAEMQSNFLLVDIMINLGYLASTMYVIFAYYKLLFLLVILGLWFISLILIYISRKNIKENKNKLWIYYFLIFLISSLLNFKSSAICIFFPQEIDERYGELLRVIIYDFVTSNLFITIIDEGNIKVHIFYFLYNFTTIVIAQTLSTKNYFFYLEILTSLFMSFIFYFFRKAYDFKIRSLFAEKFKIEKFFLYMQDFINGLDAYHLNFKNMELMFLNDKFIKLFEDKNKAINNKKIVNKDNISNFPYNAKRNSTSGFEKKNEKNLINNKDNINNNEKELNKISSPYSNPKIILEEKNIEDNIENKIEENNYNDDINDNSIYFKVKDNKNSKENFCSTERNNLLDNIKKNETDNSKENYLEIANEFMENLIPYSNIEIEGNVSQFSNFNYFYNYFFNFFSN